MVWGESDPKATVNNAADDILDMLAGVGLIRDLGGTIEREKVIRMFRNRWGDLRRAAHQLHDALEAQKTKVTPTEPSAWNEWAEASGAVKGCECSVCKDIRARWEGKAAKDRPVTRAEFEGLAAEVAKLQAGWSDVNRQLSTIRGRIGDFQARLDGASDSLKGL